MNKVLILLIAFGTYITLAAQEKKNEALLKEVSENACKSIDSIDTYNKTREQIAKEINSCIDKQVMAYQLGSKMEAVTTDKSLTAKTNKHKTIKINISDDKNSNEYKKYYYEIERYLMGNCKAIKQKIATNDVETDKAMSKNNTALDFYSQGLKEYKAENYKDAILYFEKAVATDSVFTFAWDNLGICYRRTDDYDKAIYAYKKSLELDPNGTTALQNIAVAYKYKKEYKLAIDAYDRLAVIDKNNPEVFYGLGDIYTFSLNDYEKGLDNMCKAYNKYVEQQSPYRSDAEKIISTIYSEMKKQNKLDRFNAILKENHINPVK